MNTVFSVDDFSDPFWAASASEATAGMNRSQSELALERFLEEFSGARGAIPASRAGENVIGPSLAAPHQSFSKAEEEPTAPIDSDEYRAILKKKLDQACAAVSLSRASDVKAEDSSTEAENQALQSGSQVQGSSKVQGEGYPNATPCGFSAASTAQKKSVVQVRQTTSRSSREDSEDDEFGDTETTENMDPADAKRARRMRSNRKSARRSRRRKQAQINELEEQVGQLRVVHSTSLERLTDISYKYNEAAVDNRILKADIETLRAKVKMAEETVMQLRGISPVLQSRPNVPSVVMPFVSSPSEASTAAPAPLQPNVIRFFHQPVPNTAAPVHHQRVNNSFPGNILVPHNSNSQTEVARKNVNETSALKQTPFLDSIQDQVGHSCMQKQIGPGVNISGPMPGWEPGLSHAADKNKKQG
ncbi:hypothetical protein PTKIN_Ptkin15bG0111000 [Pterospermum kingtungense]